jgi:hypothetical protein
MPVTRDNIIATVMMMRRRRRRRRGGGTYCAFSWLLENIIYQYTK